MSDGSGVHAAGARVKGDVTTHGAPVAAQVVAQHGRLAVDDGDEAGARPQQRRLPGAVGPLYEHDLARGNVEIDAGQGGEAAEERDGGVQMDGDTVHGMHEAIGGSKERSKRACTCHSGAEQVP